jgi:hypothetical protein
MRLGRGMCFAPQTVHWWQELPAPVIEVPALGSLALAGVGV